ncbi:putative ABC transporter [Aspergillus clavatus NRRL 1]|uniref:ABC transporter, putative n=1 Tax=Aspergillus clavatus (strain ATCC 1007 / CBS 513.65 / DSM 816 / NCTC 3887 / NRRL 1 / QM 1276 / 107) TaxID=344612 RepID=A1CIQ3_ASPCL|nr:ABC transporter, putative [Aspergillus clavatus NRRL 1]EAW10758.1 ABC transporter, putative [Aspergillus clavatus NRRL 1]
MTFKLIITVLEGREKRAFLQAQGMKLPPETTSSIYNRTVFWWLNRLFLTGYKNTLRFDDLYPLASDMNSAKLGTAIEKVWMKTKQTRQYALLMTTAVTLKWPLLSPVLPRIALIGFKYCQPLLLASVVNYVQLSDVDRDRNVGYGLLGATGILRNQSLEIRKGLLNVITGPVGCGKTTLLNALLGEIKISSGKVMIDHCSTAFCQQSPWLINASVRENILNQSPYDEAWYKRVIWSCALDEDIEQLPDRDDTVVGSRGISLSGGQKQRLALARAVYTRAPLVVLDDTLSALDARTEELVFDRLLSKMGVFWHFGTTVILVTHSVQHLQSADNIIVLGSEGHIEQQGSFVDLITRDGAVQRLLADCPPSTFKAADHSLESASHTIPSSKARMRTAPSLPHAAATTSLESKPVSDSAVLVYYLKSIGWYRALVFLTTSLAYVVCTSFTQIWVQWWTESKSPQDGSFLAVYFALAAGAIVNYATTIWCMMISIVPISAARLHWQLLDAVIHAPTSFFSTVDSGMTLNRFSQDMSLINSRLPVSMMQATPMAFQALAQIVLIAIGSTYMAVAIPFCLGTTWVLQRFYLRTSRQLRLLDLEQKSPLFSSISETLEGLPTIRALGWQERFERRNQERLDASQRPVYLLYCIQRWLNLVLDLIVAALAVLLVGLVTNLPSSTSGGRLGVAMLNILGFSQSLAQFIFFYTDLETSLQAVSRVKEFAETAVSEEADPSSLTQPPDD